MIKQIVTHAKQNKELALQLQINDAVANALTGLSGKYDHENYLKAIANNVSVEQLTALYDASWLAKKIVNGRPDIMTKNWRTMKFDQADKFALIENKFKLDKVVNDALCLSRQYGTAYIFMVFDDVANLSELINPIDTNNLGNIQLKNLIIYTAEQVLPDMEKLEQDIYSPNYGYPEFIRIIFQTGNSAQEYKIHRTRLIRVDSGIVNNYTELRARNFIDIPILSDLYLPILRYESAQKSVSTALKELSVTVTKSGALNQKLTSSDQKEVFSAFRKIATEKSMVNGVLLNQDDSFERPQLSLGGIPETVDVIKEDICGASSYPMQILFGKKQSSGLNNNNKEETKAFYASVREDQEKKLRPILNTLDKVLLATIFNITNEVEFDFNPIQDNDELEIAQITSLQAAYDKIYLEGQVINREILAQALAKRGTYPGLTEEYIQALAEGKLTGTDWNNIDGNKSNSAANQNRGSQQQKATAQVSG